MKLRKAFLAAGACAALLAGCASDPYTYGYGDTYYYDGAYYGSPYRYYSYAPGYYAGPSVGMTFVYRDRDAWRRYR